MDAGFILYSSDYFNSHALEITQEIYLSRDIKLLLDISNNQGPDHYLFMLGYAGWGPGQLESEIKQNAWLTSPVFEDIIFKLPVETRWEKALKKMGIDPALLLDTAGNA